MNHERAVPDKPVESSVTETSCLRRKSVQKLLWNVTAVVSEFLQNGFV